MVAATFDESQHLRIVDAHHEAPGEPEPGQPSDDSEPKPLDLPKDFIRSGIDVGLGQLSLKTSLSIMAIGQVNALCDFPLFYSYQNRLSRIVKRDSDKAHTIEILNEHEVRYVLSRVARFYRVNPKGVDIEVTPPMDVVRDLMAERDLGLPIIQRITQTPAVDREGCYPTKRGYHAATETLYWPDDDFTLPDVPWNATPEQAQEAAAVLLDAFRDFPFAEEASRAHVLVMLFQQFAANLFDLPAPFVLIDKPTPGTGATLLVDAVTMIATGRHVVATTEARDDDEMRKLIVAQLREGSQIILIDNLNNALEGQALTSLMTANTVGGRLLGTSLTLNLPNTAAWIGTGNNPRVNDEMKRRIVSIRLDAKCAKPEERTGFAHDPLMEWVKAERPKLVAAVLTIIRAWFTAGKPMVAVRPPLGSYTSYTGLMAGLLDVAGVPGFLTNRKDFEARADTDTAGLVAFLDEWWRLYRSIPTGVAQLYRIATGDDGNDDLLNLGAKNEQSGRPKLGKMLRKWADRYYQLESGDTVSVKAGKVVHKAQLWELRHVPVGGGGRLGEVFQLPYSGEMDNPLYSEVPEPPQTSPPPPFSDGGRNSLFDVPAFECQDCGTPLPPGSLGRYCDQCDPATR